MPKYLTPTDKEKDLIRKQTIRPGVDPDGVAVFHVSEDRLGVLIYKEKGPDREFTFPI